jgi:hypothetical protein
MNPFSIYHTCRESICYHEKKLVSIVLEIVKPDMIYLLGTTLYRAVITYKDDRRLYKGNLVLFCQCLLTLVTGAYIFHNDKRI